MRYPQGRHLSRLDRRAGVGPGVLIFVLAIIVAVATIILGIKATNEEVLATAEQQTSGTAAATESSVFVPTGASGESGEPETSGDADTGEANPGTPATIEAPVVSRPPAPAIAPVVEVGDVPSDSRSRAETLRDELQLIYDLADEEGASSLATSDFVRGSALKSAGDQAFADENFVQALTLYERGREVLSKAAFDAALIRFERSIDAAGLAELRQTPTPQWIQMESEVEMARANLDAGLAVEAVQMIQTLTGSVATLRTDTLNTWLNSGREAALEEQPEVALQFFRKALKLDPENAEAKEYLFTNAYETGTVVENTIGMKFAYIPPGTFTMGTPGNEAFRDNDEVQHEVTLTRGFFMGVHEVTQEQWRQVMNEPLESRIDDQRFFGPELPAHSVSWEDAVEFCKRLSEREGRRYRLPTEAEWEYAARAGTMGPYSTGGINLTIREANVYDPSGTGPMAPLPVGAAGEPNAWGLFDVHGNVWEWVSDWSGPYPEGPVVNPTGFPQDQLPSLDLAMRSVRGGSFIDDAAMARSGNRWEYSPAAANEFIGFRVVMEVDSF